MTTKTKLYLALALFAALAIYGSGFQGFKLAPLVAAEHAAKGE